MKELQLRETQEALRQGETCWIWHEKYWEGTLACIESVQYDTYYHSDERDVTVKTNIGDLPGLLDETVYTFETEEEYENTLRELQEYLAKRKAKHLQS